MRIGSAGIDNGGTNDGWCGWCCEEGCIWGRREGKQSRVSLSGCCCLLCFALSGDLALYIFECVAPVGMKVWVAEGPALERNQGRRGEKTGEGTCSPKWLSSEFLTLWKSYLLS